MTKDSCSSCSVSSFDDRTCYDTEDCSYLQNSCEACGWEWTPYIDGNTDVYICGGYDFCQARYGGGIWDKRYQSGSVIGYGCVGDGYCQAVYGAGTWQITQSSSATEQYGCGGNDYCAVTVGGNSVWKCSEDVYMGTMCSCTQAS